LRSVTLLDLKLGHFQLTAAQRAELISKAGPIWVEIGLRVLRERMAAQQTQAAMSGDRAAAGQQEG
jgi:hypothetical protein